MASFNDIETRFFSNFGKPTTIFTMKSEDSAARTLKKGQRAYVWEFNNGFGFFIQMNDRTTAIIAPTVWVPFTDDKDMKYFAKVAGTDLTGLDFFYAERPWRSSAIIRAFHTVAALPFRDNSDKFETA